MGFGACDGGGDEPMCQEGTEGCPCISGECLSGLTCASNLCVALEGMDDDDDEPTSDDSSYQPFLEGADCNKEGTMICESSLMGDTTGRVIRCNGATYEAIFECPGLQECETIMGNDQVNCGGTYYSLSGGPCANEGSQVCSFDAEVVLKCDAGEWIDAVHCPPSNCARVPEGTDSCSGHWCSNCGYSVGDVCSFPAGRVVCATDLSAILQCASGRTAVSTQCGGGTTCTSVIQDGETVLVCQ